MNRYTEYCSVYFYQMTKQFRNNIDLCCCKPFSEWKTLRLIGMID